VGEKKGAEIQQHPESGRFFETKSNVGTQQVMGFNLGSGGANPGRRKGGGGKQAKIELPGFFCGRVQKGHKVSETISKQKHRRGKERKKEMEDWGGNRQTVDHPRETN